jgi:hypothetical protein
MAPRTNRIPALVHATLSLSLLLASASPTWAHGGGHGGGGSGGAGHGGSGGSRGMAGRGHHGGGVINPSTVHHPSGSGRGLSSWSGGAGASGSSLAFNPYDLPEARLNRFVQHLFNRGNY